MMEVEPRGGAKPWLPPPLNQGLDFLVKLPFISSDGGENLEFPKITPDKFVILMPQKQ